MQIFVVIFLKKKIRTCTYFLYESQVPVYKFLTLKSNIRGTNSSAHLSRLVVGESRANHRHGGASRFFETSDIQVVRCASQFLNPFRKYSISFFPNIRNTKIEKDRIF